MARVIVKSTAQPEVVDLIDQGGDVVIDPSLGSVRLIARLGKLYLKDALGSEVLIGDAGGHVAPGVVQPYGGATAPTGTLMCDGSAYNTTDYPDLYAAIGNIYDTQRNQSTGANYSAPGSGKFRVPDYRGVYLRGVGTAKDSGGVSYTGITLGQTLDDATAKNGLANATSSVSASGSGNTGTESASHTHGGGSLSVSGLYATTTAYGYSNVGSAARWDDRRTVGTSNSIGGSTGTQSANHTHGFSVSVSGTAAAQAITGDTETRPVSVGVNYIIKT